MSEHPFRKMMGSSSYQDRQRAIDEVRYEESRVSFLLKNLGFSANNVRSLRRLNEKETGFSKLTFEMFNKEYSSFPIVLGSSRLNGVKLHTDKRAMIPSLFNSFCDAPFVEAYEDFYENIASNSQERAIGLVFPRKGLRHGLVIYNEGLDAIAYHGLTLVYTGISEKRGKHKGKAHQLFVRPFQTLIEAIHNRGHGWHL